MTRKQKKILTILSCNLLFLVAVALIWTFLLNPVIRFPEEAVVLEKGWEYPALDFIEKTNGTVTPERVLMYTDEVGERDFEYSVKRWLFTKTYSLHYEVVDTTPPEITLLTDRIALEIGTPYTEADMLMNVTADEGEFTFETDYDPAFPGSYTVNVTATDPSGNRSDARYEIIVGDTEAPMVFRSGNGAQYEIGEEFDITRLLSYGDNADPAPVLETRGDVDTSEVGSYTVHASLTDVSGNRTDWDFTVEVVEEIETDDTQPPFYPFSDFMADHAGEGRHFGIDISRWQGDIDFNKVKNAGCEFVIMRIGYSEEGELFLEKYYEQNIERAKSAGIPVGLYVFSYESTEEQVRASTRMLLKQIEGMDLELPIVFDWENFSHFQQYGISFQELNHLYDVFEEEVTAAGYDSMLYGSKFYLQNVWKHTDTRPIWLAHFTSQTNYEGQYSIWQASATGKLPGIDAYVDMNILYD